MYCSTRYSLSSSSGAPKLQSFGAISGTTYARNGVLVSSREERKFYIINWSASFLWENDRRTRYFRLCRLFSISNCTSFRANLSNHSQFEGRIPIIAPLPPFPTFNTKHSAAIYTSQFLYPRIQVCAHAVESCLPGSKPSEHTRQQQERKVARSK
jgi:hypothetical protein